MGHNSGLLTFVEIFDSKSYDNSAYAELLFGETDAIAVPWENHYRQ